MSNKNVLHEIADVVVLLTVDNTKKDYMLYQFEKLNITSTVFWGILGKDIEYLCPPDAVKKFGLAAMGNCASYRQIMARYRNTKAIALFEDNVILTDDFNFRLKTFLENVPKNWDMLYLCGNHIENPKFISEGIYKLSATYGILGVIIRNTIYNQIEDLLNKFWVPFDCITKDIQCGAEAYCIDPHIVYTYLHYSIGQKKLVFYKTPSPSLFNNKI